VPVAVICVADTRFVVNAVVPKKTVAPGAKFAPATVSVNAPTGIDVGVTEETCGTGLFRVTTPLPLIAVFALSAAVIVTVLGVGGNCGAVNMPLAVIVPVLALPPVTPLTDQTSAGVDPSLVLAVKGSESPPRIVADAGVTLSVALCGCCGFPLLLPKPPQPARTSAEMPSNAIHLCFTASLLYQFAPLSFWGFKRDTPRAQTWANYSFLGLDWTSGA